MEFREALRASKNKVVQDYLGGLSTLAIGKQFGCSNALVYKFLRDECNVEMRGQSDYTDKFEKIRELSLAGLSLSKISKELDIPLTSLSRIRKKLNLNNKHVWHTREDPLYNHKDEIISRYLNGESTYQLGKVFNCQDSSIVRFLQKNNIQLRLLKQYSCNESFFENIDTNIKAQILGLLLSDGWVSLKHKCFALSMIDQDIIEKVKVVLKYDGPIYKQKPRKKQRLTQYRLYIRSETMVQDLVRLGCVERKSLILEYPLVDDKFLAGLTLGYFDGDGAIYRNRSGSWVCNFAGTIMFLSVLKNKLENLGIKCSSVNIVTEGKTTAQFNITHKDNIYKFLTWLYRDATIYMDRKYQKYQEFLKYYEESQKN